MIRTKALAAAVALLAAAVALVMIFDDVNMPSDTPSRYASFPAVSLPRFAEDAPKFTSANLGQEAVVVNFFSSWCGPCRVEHPLLMELKEVAPIIGINYMDDHAKAQEFLGKLGNPYRDIAIDQNGDFGVALGIDSVPRTLVVAGGRIVYAHRGILKREEIDQHLMPVLKQYRKKAGFRLS